MLSPTVFTKTGKVKQSVDVALLKLKERSKLEKIWQVQDVDVTVQKDPH